MNMFMVKLRLLARNPVLKIVLPIAKQGMVYLMLIYVGLWK